MSAGAARFTEPLELLIQNTARQYMLKLEELWQEMGMSVDQIQRRRKTVTFHMEALFNGMLEEENMLKKTLQYNVSKFGAKIEEYRKQLRIEDSKALEELVFSNDESATCNNRASSGLVRQEKRVKTLFLKLKEMISSRKEQVDRLIEEEEMWCGKLDETFSFQPGYEDLSLKKIDQLEEKVDTLRIEYDERYQKFLYLRSKIMDQMKTREISAQDSFIQSVIHNKEPKITLSLSNLEKLKCFSENISTMQKRQQTEELKNCIEPLLEKCRLKKLSVGDLEKIERILRELDKEENQIADVTVSSLTEQMKKLEILYKKQLISEIHVSRSRLTLLEKESFVSTMQNEICTRSDSEESIGHLEQKLSNIHDETKRIELEMKNRQPVIAQLQAWKKSFNRIKTLECTYSDPDRLKNRGCTLLKEEKEKKQLRRQIVKVEKDVKEVIANWEREHADIGNQTKFMVFDTSVEKYFEKEWRDLEQIKHAMTEQRKLKRKRETEDEMRFGTMNPRKYSYQSTAKRFKHSDIHNVTAKRKDQFPAAGFMTSWGEIKGAPAKSKLSTVPGCRQKAQARDTGFKTTESIWSRSNIMRDAARSKARRRRSKSESDIRSLFENPKHGKKDRGQEDGASSSCKSVARTSNTMSNHMSTLMCVPESSSVHLEFSETVFDEPKEKSTLGLSDVTNQRFNRTLNVGELNKQSNEVKLK